MFRTVVNGGIGHMKAAGKIVWGRRRKLRGLLLWTGVVLTCCGADPQIIATLAALFLGLLPSRSSSDPD